MKICIYGAGAIGGHLAVRLAAKGEVNLSLVARGPQLEAIRTKGLILRSGETELSVRPRVSDDPASLGKQDVIIVAVKAPALPKTVDGLLALHGKDTAIVYALNGIPWWYFHGAPGALSGRRLPLLDPEGRLWNEIGPSSAIGCVVYSANEIVEPGVVLNRSPQRNEFILGEPNGSLSPRVNAVAAALTGAGLRAPTTESIRDAIWRKFLVGNMTLSVLATLTMSPSDALAADPELAPLCRLVVEEGKALAEELKS